MTQLPGVLMAAEIAEQPQVLAGLLADGADPIAEVAAALRKRRTRFVLFAARGTSDHAALYGKYLVELRLGLPAGLVSPSTMTIYGAHPDLTDVLFVAVSQSGRVPRSARLGEGGTRGRRDYDRGDQQPGIAARRRAQYQVDIGAGIERAVAATKTYTAELLALYLLFAGMSQSVGDGLDALPAAAAATLDSAARADELAAVHRGAGRMIVTGRGYAYATAREAALKLMETSYLSAHAFSAADLLHGPMALVDAATPVLVVATPGLGGDAMRPVLDRVAALHAAVLIVGPSAGLPVVTDGIGEALHPLLQILPLQRFAWGLALARGSDPDRPRGLSKITETW